MRPTLHFLFLLPLLLASMVLVACTPLIQLDEGFLAMADHYEADIQNFTRADWRFAEFEVVSTRFDPGYGDSDRELLGSERTEERARSYGFVLTADGADTVNVEALWARWEEYYDRAIFNDNQLLLRTDTLSAEILDGPRANRWVFELITQQEGEDEEAGWDSWGSLKGGELSLDVVPVREGAEDAGLLSLPPLGYRFALGGRTVGAVQPGFLNDGDVRLARGLSPPLRRVLAAAFCVLLVERG